MFPKTHLTSLSNVSGSTWVTTPLWLSGSLKTILYTSYVSSCHLFLICSVPFRSLPFRSFIVPIFAWNIPLISPIFLKRSLVFPILLFSSMFLCIVNLRRLSDSSCYSLELCIQLGVSFPFSLAFHFFLFSAICKASSDKQSAFFHFFFFGMVLVTTSCTMLQTYSHRFSDTLSTRSNLLNQCITSNV